MREVVTARVAFADTDAMGVAWHGNYLVWFEMGRTELLRSTGLAYRELVDRNIHLPVIEAACRYHRPARYDDLLSVRCAAHPVRGVRLRIDYEIHSEGALLASGYTLHAFTDERGRVIRPSADILERLNSLAGEEGKEALPDAH